MQIGRDGLNWQYNDQLCREMATKMVIQCGLPFSILDNPIVTEWIQTTLQPKYTQVTRMTLKRYALKMWGIAKKEMQDYFLNFDGKVSFTCDLWQVPYGSSDSYICITCHWIDMPSWQMMKQTICFETFGFPHDGSHLFSITMKHLTLIT